MPTVAEYLLARLGQLGLGHVFAVPGDYAADFLEALDASPEITRVATIGELGAGYAADGYARYKGIGAACVQYGVGTFSLLNCTAGSFVERVPVVVISASPTTQDRQLERTRGVLFHHSTGDLEADKRVFDNVTVASEIVHHATEAPEQIDRALTALLTHHRPIYIEVQADVWTKDCASPEGRLQATPTVSDPAAVAAAVDAAWARIEEAKLPVLWAGVELQRLGLQGQFQALVEQSGLPFTTTSLAKTVLDEGQGHFIGTYAGPASPARTRAIMDACDCPVALGILITDDYLDIISSKYDRMVLSTASDTRVGFEHFREVALADVLAGLLARAERSSPRTDSLPEAPDEAEASSGVGDPLTYNLFSRELGAYLTARPQDEIALVLGESTSLYVFGNLFGLGRDVFVGGAAWGSLGHETGCALGVALGSGRRPWVVAGDGGFRMVCQELSSLAQSRCNAVVFVLRNDVYAIEQAFVDLKAFEPDGEFAPFDVLPPWDYAALAKAFGAQGHRVKTVEELRALLPDLEAVRGAPSLVEVVIPQKDLPPQLERLARAPAPLLRAGRP